MRKFALMVVALALAASVPVSLLARQDDGEKKEHSKKEVKDKNPLPPYNGPKKRLAIMDIEVKSAPVTDSGANTGIYDNGTGQVSPTANATATGDLGTGLAEMLASSLADSNRFILLERKAMADITAEQQLNAGAGFDPTTAAKPGQMLGAQFLIRGAVTEFANSHNTQNGSGILQNLGISSDHSESTVAIDIRIYEVATGVMLDAVKGEGKVRASATGVNFSLHNLNLGSSGSQTSPLAEAARKAISDAVKKICLRLDKIPWEGHVAEMDAAGSDVKYLYLGTGSSGGLKVGQHFSISHPGRTIVDPDTKVIIGRTKDNLVGHGVLESVTDKLATISIVDGTGFAVGDIVRWDDAPPVVATPAVAPTEEPAKTSGK